MKAESLLRKAQPREALVAIEQEIKKQPGDWTLRLTMIHLLLLLGEWQRALIQLQTIVSLNAKFEKTAHLYRLLIELETVRSAVISAKREPTIWSEKQDWITLLTQNLGLIHEKPKSSVINTWKKALEQAPARSGIVNGEKFEWISNADARFGPLLEAYFGGNYYWVPFERLSSIVVSKPLELIELVWSKAELTFVDGTSVNTHLPVRYPGTEGSQVGRVLMSQTNHWIDHGNGFLIGTGVQVLSTNTQDYALTTIRNLQFGKE